MLRALQLWSLVPISLALAVTYIDPSGCVNPNGPTTFPACNLLADKLDSCSTYHIRTAFQDCYCQPAVLSAIYECDSEDRLCQDNPAPDGQYQQVASAWHAACDPLTSFSFNTPPLSTLTTTISPGFCSIVAEACISGQQFFSACLQSYSTQAQAFGNCLCAPRVLSLAYTCEYLGNISCGVVPGGATLSEVQGWGTCRGYESILTSNMPASVSASITYSSSNYTFSTTTPSSSMMGSTRANQPPTSTEPPSSSTSISPMSSMISPIPFTFLLPTSSINTQTSAAVKMTRYNFAVYAFSLILMLGLMGTLNL